MTKIQKAAHRWSVSTLLTSSQLETCCLIKAIIEKTGITSAKAQVFVPEIYLVHNFICSYFHIAFISLSFFH